MAVLPGHNQGFWIHPDVLPELGHGGAALLTHDFGQGVVDEPMQARRLDLAVDAGLPNGPFPQQPKAFRLAHPLQIGALLSQDLSDELTEFGEVGIRQVQCARTRLEQFAYRIVPISRH